jgi:hypothetical protein
LPELANPQSASIGFPIQTLYKARSLPSIALNCPEAPRLSDISRALLFLRVAFMDAIPCGRGAAKTGNEPEFASCLMPGRVSLQPS